MRAFRPEDIFLLKSLSDPRLSPSTGSVAVTETVMDGERNEYRSRIYLLDNEGIRPFTNGEHRESRPRWSPDGKSIAFVAHGRDKGSELMIIPATGGEAIKVVELPEDIEDLDWSPDGHAIAFIARDRDERMHGAEKPKDRSAKKIDRLVYRLDNFGWTVGRIKQLFVVAAEQDAKPTCLTTGGSGVGSFSWSPDGSQIAFTAGLHDTWDSDLFTDIYVVASGGGEPKAITDTDSGYSQVSWAPDGAWVAYLWRQDPINGPFHARVGIVSPVTGETKILTSGLDRTASPYPPQREPQWNDDHIYFAAEDSGNVHIYRTHLGGDTERVISDEGQVTGFDLVGSKVAVVHATAISLTELSVTETSSPAIAPSRTTSSSSLDELDVIAPERFTAISSDGAEVEAWIMKPSGFDPTKKYPALLNIHGGPFTQYGNKLFDEFQVYAGAGYVVIYCNPRGSSGYSEEWGRAIRGPKAEPPGSGWGTLDYDDIMAVTDEALKRSSFIDPERMGVLGGSYGGYMTSWIVGHSDRFRAACSERAVNNMYTEAYTADIGVYFSRELGPLYLDDLEEYQRRSPITYIRDINTPLLILHADDDLRCPIEQAEQMYFGLKMLGKEVEFYRFPGEGHELSRSGAPAHRVERFEIILEFFDKHLKP
ncbi:MAG TPA: S9 family peptidase [Actinomycetota bacterium]|nr:S9 family peptidase [Actinomycetota bacterium]